MPVQNPLADIPSSRRRDTAPEFPAPRTNSGSDKHFPSPWQPVSNYYTDPSFDDNPQDNYVFPTPSVWGPPASDTDIVTEDRRPDFNRPSPPPFTGAFRTYSTSEGDRTRSNYMPSTRGGVSSPYKDITSEDVKPELHFADTLEKSIRDMQICKDIFDGWGAQLDR